METMLQIENVSKHFHSKRKRLLVLDNISLTVAKGEFLCITGPSGCGKTTLINIIAGLEQASGGCVLMNGAEIKGPGSDRAVVFQEPALFPWLTVIENVEFPLKTAGIPKEKRHTDAMKCLETVHLIGEQFRPPPGRD